MWGGKDGDAMMHRAADTLHQSSLWVRWMFHPLLPNVCIRLLSLFQTYYLSCKKYWPHKRYFGRLLNKVIYYFVCFGLAHLVCLAINLINYFRSDNVWVQLLGAWLSGIMIISVYQFWPGRIFQGYFRLETAWVDPQLSKYLVLGLSIPIPDSSAVLT